MKDQITNFDTAILAKKAGFDECTEYVYTHENLLDPCIQDGRSNSTFIGTSTCSAPTQSLLERWLREKFKLYITIHYHKSGKFFTQVYDECENGLSMELFGEMWDTFEIALKEALQYALKTIK